MADKDILRKREQFIKEIGNRPLTPEQQRIFYAFTHCTTKPLRFAVDDKSENTIRFYLVTDKLSEGTLHILDKHYNGIIGRVSALEIVQLCDVIRKGDLTLQNGNYKYTYKKHDKTFTLIVYLKKTVTKKNMLKSFYSNRRK